MPLCPQCQHDIPSEDLNVGADAAYCRPCDRAFALSMTVHGVFLDRMPQPTPTPTAAAKAHESMALEPVDLYAPPKGCDYTDDGGTATVSSRLHRKTAWEIVCFSLIWNCFTWFGVMSLIIDSNQSGKRIYALSISVIPFVACGAILAWLALTGLFGHYRVRVRANEAVVSVGVLGVYWNRAFRPSDVTEVVVGPNGHIRKTVVKCVLLKNISLKRSVGKPVLFGSYLTEAGRMFMASALVMMLRVKGEVRSRSDTPELHDYERPRYRPNDVT